MRNVNKAGLELIKQWEGKKLRAYVDTGGVLTIGYGHTSAAGAPKVVSGMQITEEEATEILKRDIDGVETSVEKLVKVPLSDNQFGALVAFVYNIGETQFKGSTLLRKLNQGKYDAVPGELAKWVNDNGKRIKGLVNRRAAEAGLWVKGDFVSSNTAPVQRDKANAETVTVGAGGVGSAVAVSVQPVIDVLTGQQDALTSGNIAKMVVALIIVGLTIYFIMKKRAD